MESWILDCPQGIVIVDTAIHPQSVEKIGDELRTIGKTWNNVKLILITHKHGDHIKEHT